MAVTSKYIPTRFVSLDCGCLIGANIQNCFRLSLMVWIWVSVDCIRNEINVPLGKCGECLVNSIERTPWKHRGESSGWTGVPMVHAAHNQNERKNNHWFGGPHYSLSTGPEGSMGPPTKMNAKTTTGLGVLTVPCPQAPKGPWFLQPK